MAFSRSLSHGCFLTVFLSAACPLFGQETTSAAQKADAAAQSKEIEMATSAGLAVADYRQQKAATKDFLGVSLGVSFGVSFDAEAGDRVDEAEVVNGIVRVKKESNARPRVLLEAHHFWPINAKDPDIAKMGLGPFAAIQGSDKEVVEGFAFGLMLGLKRKPISPSSFNIGFGFVVDPSVKTLGDGLAANQPLPTGETQVRLKEESRVGVVLLVSFAF